MKFFSSLILACFVLPCFAHEGDADSTHADKKEHRNEFGLDMIYFLNIFRNQYEPSNENTMVFAFDRHLQHEHIVRFFLSAGFVKSNTKEDTVPLVSNRQSDLIALPGFGWERHAGRRWAYFYGVQAKIENAAGRDVRGDNNTSGLQTTSFSNWYYGPSAFTGLKFRFNDRISIQTEMDIGFIFYNTSNSFRNEKYPSQDYATTVNGFSTEYILPRTILLNFTF